MNEGGHFRLPEQQPPFEIPSSSTLSLSGPSVSHYYTSPSTRPFSYKPIPVATRTDVHQPKSWPAQSGSAIFGRYPIASQLQTPNGGFTDPAYQADEASIFADNFRRGPREDFNHPSSLQFPANIAANHVEAVGVSSSAHGNRTSNGKPRPSIEARKENIPAHTSSSTSEQDNKSVNKTTIFDDMPQGAQSWDRGPENSAVHRPASVRSSMSRQSFHNDPSAQEDGRRSGLSSRDVDDPAKQTILRARQVDAYTEAKTGLPNEKGFPIQIGSELFRLSGASIMSDGQ